MSIPMRSPELEAAAVLKVMVLFRTIMRSEALAASMPMALLYNPPLEAPIVMSLLSTSTLVVIGSGLDSFTVAGVRVTGGDRYTIHGEAYPAKDHDAP